MDMLYLHRETVTDRMNRNVIQNHIYLYTVNKIFCGDIWYAKILQQEVFPIAKSPIIPLNVVISTPLNAYTAIPWHVKPMLGTYQKDAAL